MANKERGEADLAVGDKTYVLRLTWNEIAKFETVRGVAWFEDFAPKLMSPNSISAGEWIALLWSGLQDKHSDVSLIDAGDILTKAGLQPTAEALMDCLRYTFPDPENPQ